MAEFLKGSGQRAQLANQGWNILDEQVSLPVAVVKQNAISQNAKWMSQFAARSEVLLAPHGKTTMSIELFQQQLAEGAWAITLATVPQVVNAAKAGIKRIILANQLVGKYHFELISELLRQFDIEFYCFVDSIENATALGEYFNQHAISLNILLEVGVEEGRCGWRDLSTLDALVNTCQRYRCLEIAGLGFYEGVISGQNAQLRVTEFVQGVADKAFEFKVLGYFNNDAPIITGAGSAWYDVVAQNMNQVLNKDDFRLVIRPGCYLIHDTGIYAHAQHEVLARSQLACDINGDLVSSLYIWAYVASIPESGLAIIAMGKRDVAFDAGLPIAEFHYCPVTQCLKVVDADMRIEKIMDQHCMMRYSTQTTLKVGDMLCFSTSHPCLTFDKWRQIGVIEQDWVITKTISTHF